MRKKIIHIILVAGFILSHVNSFSQPSYSSQQKTRILFLLDASSSMLNPWGSGTTTRMETAKKVLWEIMDTLKRKPNLEMALRVYGDQSATPLNDCSDSRLLVPFGTNNFLKLKEALHLISPKGVTPIALSLQKAANDFPVEPNVRNIIILITDGEESCGGDPCAISLALQKIGAVLRPFVIGAKVDEASLGNLECMGSFFNALDPDGFKQAIRLVVQKVLNPVYVQVNLLDQQGRPVETDVDMTFYDTSGNIPRYDYVHTISYKGVSDTLTLDPVMNYNMVVHTNPEIERKNIVIEQGKNNIINVPAPQGYLYLKLQSTTIYNNINNKIKCLVRRTGDLNTFNVQNIDATDKYLTGKYDLEFLTLPRTFIPNVDISQSKTTTIEIPTPGILTVMKPAPGFGAVFIIENNELKKLCTLGENGGNETIALQPGTYKVIFKPKFSKRTTDTLEKTFTITSGGNTSIRL